MTKSYNRPCVDCGVLGRAIVGAIELPDGTRVCGNCAEVRLARLESLTKRLVESRRGWLALDSKGEAIEVSLYRAEAKGHLDEGGSLGKVLIFFEGT
jgi:hypothetical protein